ncbi:MAG: phage holin family protein [Synergistaceae bacterium]|nr:phage holin family protein [Synergistaceae bacterium]MBQ6908480.1 phage holin family protein [Synergistaceae bacterium]
MIEHLDWIAGFFGAAFGWYFGKLDGFLYALLAFSTADYISGVMAAWTKKELSSAVGFKGIAGKVMIFALVGVANVLDMLLFGQADTLRTAVILFYIANESLSVIENAIKLNVPIPDALKDKLTQLHGSSQEISNDKNNNEEKKKKK